ncbi:MAG TPA: undecaprenyl diphosphate synthase family protein, partial [Longimicrobiaceae bacterium]|nr:undecaprenyl diphosphate synthase family protein [Longimicrobiaceae bacterium]
FLRHLPGVADRWHGTALVFAPVLLTWASDTFAYFVGRAFGRRKLIPRVSPGKTVEGSLGALAPEEIDEELFASELYTADIPDPDLLIRTSGEFRISNFMLWQLAYTELHVTSVLWPDFRREHLFQAIRDFQRRERRFGRVAAS